MGTAPWWSFRDLLPDLAAAYGVQFVADAYASTPAGFLTPQSIPPGPVSLSFLLDHLAEPSHHWDRHDHLIRLRSRNWYLDRPQEIPLRLARRWKTLHDRYDALPFDEYVQMAAELSDP